MQVVRIYRLNNLSLTRFCRLKQARMDAARVWNECMGTHKEARLDHLTWSNERSLRQAVKGSFALHSQLIQAFVRTFVTTIATTRRLRKEHPEMRSPLRVRKRSSRADTPQRCLDQPPAQPHLAEMVSLGAGSPGSDVQKPAPNFGTGVSLRS